VAFPVPHGKQLHIHCRVESQLSNPISLSRRALEVQGGHQEQLPWSLRPGRAPCLHLASRKEGTVTWSSTGQAPPSIDVHFADRRPTARGHCPLVPSRVPGRQQ
jgi:hypothetical protein